MLVAMILVLFLLSAQAAELPADRLWLNEARIAVRLGQDGAHQVVQTIQLAADEDRLIREVEHSLFLGEAKSLSRLSARTPRGPLEIRREKKGVITRLWVEAGEAKNLFSYELTYEVVAGDGQPFRCPLAVPAARPRDPHDTVTISVTLPPNRELTGLPFPNLEKRGRRLLGRTGGIPVYVRAPNGDPSVDSWLTRYGVDSLVLVLIIASVMIAVRYRERGPRRRAQ